MTKNSMGQCLRRAPRPLDTYNHQTGAHSKVPARFDEENSYTNTEHPSELYDLRTDHAQKQKLYAKEPATVKKLADLLKSIRAKGQVR